MGGIGSGARRSTHIGNVEEMLALDIRVLRRLGVVRPGECVCDTVHWSIGGLSTSSARLRIDLSEIERGSVMSISGGMFDGAIKQRVAIEMVPSPFGGHRCYFICPFTARRCEVIYYAGGRFGSREAQRLSYAVQGMNDISRARRKTASYAAACLDRAISRARADAIGSIPCDGCGKRSFKRRRYTSIVCVTLLIGLVPSGYPATPANSSETTISNCLRMAIVSFPISGSCPNCVIPRTGTRAEVSGSRMGFFLTRLTP